MSIGVTDLTTLEWELACFFEALMKSSPYGKPFIEFKGLMSVIASVYAGQNDYPQVIRLEMCFSEKLTPETVEKSSTSDYFQNGNYIVQEFFRVPDGVGNYFWAKPVVQRVRQFLIPLGWRYTGQSDEGGNLRCIQKDCWQYDFFRGQ